MPSYKWRVVAMLWCISFFNYADRQAIFSVFPLLEREMHLTPVQLGLLGSGFAWVYGLGAPFAGMVVDRVQPQDGDPGRPARVERHLRGDGGCRATSRQLFLFRAAEGLGRDVLLPGVDVAHQRLSRPRHALARAGPAPDGVYMGTIGGGFFAGLIAEHYGWRLSFVVFGGLGVLLGLVLRRFLVEPVRGARGC